MYDIDRDAVASCLDFGTDCGFESGFFSFAFASRVFRESERIVHQKGRKAQVQSRLFTAEFKILYAAALVQEIFEASRGK